MRYAFNDVSIAFQELEWHLFATVFLLGIPYAIKAGGHVRVDLFYERLSMKAQAVIDILGTLFSCCRFACWWSISGSTLPKKATRWVKRLVTQVVCHIVGLSRR